MRTTLNIDDAILSAAKELARREGKTTGEVISELARRALMNPTVGSAGTVRELEATYGFRPFPRGEPDGGPLVTNEAVDRLRDELGV